MALTARQKMFVSEYLIDLNATQAAIRAGYSEKYADRIGHELLEKTRVKEAIQEQMKARQQRTLVTADYVINMIRSVADNTEKDSDRLKACELLGKHLKLFTDKTELTGKDDSEIIIKVSLTDD